MFLALVLAAATPVIAVVHDGTAQSEVTAAATHLSAGGTVTATAVDAAISPSCVRSSACTERPAADFLLVMSKMATKVHLELVDKSGTTVSIEDVDVTDPAVLDASLAPALDRISTKAITPPSTASEPSSTPSESGTNWLPWVLGGAGVCAAVGVGGCCLLAVASSKGPTAGGGATTGGNNTGANTNNNGLDQACSAPFDSCTSGINACGDVGNAGTDACSGVGDSLSGACGSLGNIGACAVMPAAAMFPPSARAPDETGREYAPGAMRY